MLLVKNRRALYDYKIKETWVAGIVLQGHEVKSLRAKQASLKGSYVSIKNNEAWLINAHISPYQYADLPDYDPNRSRKLLLTKKEIYQLQAIEDSSHATIVPLELILVNNKIKLKIGAGQGKKQYEKRRKTKKRDLKRQLAKEFKEKNLRL